MFVFIAASFKTHSIHLGSVPAVGILCGLPHVKNRLLPVILTIRSLMCSIYSRIVATG